MRKIMISVIAMMMVVGLMVSCDNANISPELKAEELVSVSFDEGASRGLTGSIEAFSKENYYWKYAAQKADTSGLISGQTPSYDERGAEWINKGENGKSSKTDLGKVEGFSQGYWNFKLFAYTDNEGNNLAYTGEITGQLLKKGDSNKVMVTVAPIASGNGTLKVDTAHISFVPKQNSALTAEQLNSFEKVVTVQKWEISGVTGETVNNPEPDNGALTYSLPAGTYKVTVKFVRNDNITYTEGYAIATVYSNVTTIVSGYLDEFTTNADFDSDAEVINRVAVSESKNIPTSGDVFNENVVLNDSVEISTDSKVTAVVPKDSANLAVKSAVDKSEFTDGVKSRSAALHLTVDTTAATKSSVTLEIGMSSVLTTKLQDDNTNHVETVPVKELNHYVTVKVNLSAGLSNVAVKHTVEGNVLDMHEVSSTEIEGNNFTIDSDNAGVFYYNDGNGTLTIKTKTFSPFEVSYIAPVWVAKIGSTKYLSLQSAIDEASDGSIIELMTDVVVDGEDPVIINTSNKLEINLNGNSITGNGMRALWVKAGDVSITGTGTISSTKGIDDDSSVIRVADKYSNEDEAKLTIGSNVVVSSDYSYAITVFGFNKGTLVVDGTIRSKDVPAISGNGSSSLKETDITINGSVEATGENAIYHPQAGILTINGTVTGKGGIEAKSGNIIINSNGKVIATSDVLSHDKNSNGCSTQGYAIAAVNNNKYKSNVLVEIKNGAEITGIVAIKNDSVSLSDGKSKAVIHSESSSYSKETNSMWLKLYSDSFYTLMEKWDDYAVEEYATSVDETNKVVTIASAEELALFASQVKGGNSYSGYTVNLTNDIDLSGKLWTPIGNSKQYFKGTFNGNNHIISNLLINTSSSNTGFFSFVSDATITNLKINNAYVNSSEDSNSVGIITGKAYSGVTISNIEVTGKIFVSGGWYVGGINGGYSYARYENCTVDGSNTENYQSIIKSTVSGDWTNYVGGICGQTGEGGRGIYNCKVKNITLQTTNGGYGIGGIAGVMQYNYTISGCTVDNVKLVHSVNADDAVEWIGTIVGKDYTQNSNTISKIINCVSTNVSVYVGNNQIASGKYWVIGDNHVGTYAPFEQYVANLVVGNDISYDTQNKFISGNVIFVGANALTNANGLLAEGYEYVLNEDDKSYRIQPTNSN